MHEAHFLSVWSACPWAPYSQSEMVLNVSWNLNPIIPEFEGACGEKKNQLAMKDFFSVCLFCFLLLNFLYCTDPRPRKPLVDTLEEAENKT